MLVWKVEKSFHISTPFKTMNGDGIAATVSYFDNKKKEEVVENFLSTF